MNNMLCLICNTETTNRMFCSTHCKDDYHNIRKLRGNQVYDLLMTRSANYKNRNLLTVVDRLVRSWRAEDAEASRRTYQVFKPKRPTLQEGQGSPLVRKRVGGHLP